MINRLGLHWIRVHADSGDFAHIEAMQYPSAKTFEWMHGDRGFCANLLSVLPKDAYLLARNHPRSEQKEDVWRDPVGTGKRHADEWAADLRGGRCYLPTDRTFFLPVNEPDATSGDRAAIDRYTVAYLDRLREHGLRGGAFNFSTGHPRTVDGTPNTKADYNVFEASHAAIVRGRHIGVLHIYGTAAVPLAPGHYDRLRACPWTDVQWVVGEFGIDEHVIGGGAHHGYLVPFGSRPDAYCAWLDTAIGGIADPRIHSYQVFSYDYSKPWDSFDARVVRRQLETYAWTHAAKTPSTPTTVYAPVAAKPGGAMSSTWERCIAWVMRWEGGFQNDPNDKGNYYNGRLIGTKYGISAASWGGEYDIPNLTIEQAKDIYYQHYWLASGADKLDWPLCLLQMDTAVLHGTGTARGWLAEVGPNAYLYAAKRLHVYLGMDTWHYYGAAWTRRTAELLEEMAQ